MDLRLLRGLEAKRFFTRLAKSLPRLSGGLDSFWRGRREEGGEKEKGEEKERREGGRSRRRSREKREGKSQPSTTKQAHQYLCPAIIQNGWEKG